VRPVYGPRRPDPWMPPPPA